MTFSWIKLKQVAPAMLITAASLMLFSSNRSEAISTMKDNGSDIFRARCAVCHGLDGSGNTTQGKKLNARDLRSDDVQQLSDDELLEIIAHGKGEMPAFQKKLSQESIKQVIIHVRKLSTGR
jgi:mono/diheme cytochrome c family protein